MSKFPDEWMWLEVLELGEPEVNALRIVVAEARKREKVKDMIAPGIEMEASPLTVGPDSRVFEIVWRNYVSYAVTNESYAVPQDEANEEIRAKGPLRELRNSEFLKFVLHSTWARNEHPGPLTHWCLGCSWHVIDVVSWENPKIRELTGYNFPEIDTDAPTH